jgi:RHS repeat-associated protein
MQWDSLRGGYAVTNYTYDSFGNVVSEADPLGATTVTTFDPIYHVFPIENCDALGHCTLQEWDPLIGQAQAITDANGNVTTYDFDTFGRPSLEARADGGTIRFEYLDWGNPATQRLRETFSDGTPDGLWREVYYDGLGRIYKSAREGGFTKHVVFSDSSNRLWKESDWHSSSEPALFELYAYDGIGRLRTVTHADGTSAEYVYGNGSTATLDELHHQRIVWTDIFGRTTQVKEISGSQEHLTTYAYDVLDHLVQSFDAVGNECIFTWDSLGRKLAVCDADAGCWSYSYDLAGRVSSQEDAKGQVTTFTYDPLGRMTSETRWKGSQASWVAQWRYDEAGHGASVGHVTRIDYPGGSESFDYDIGGRQTRQVRCVQGSCCTIEQDWDEIGRLASVTYPDGEQVGYSYDEAGRLSRVLGYVDLLAYDARDQIVSIDYANGTSASYEYDPARRWMLSAEVRGSDASLLFDASYGYDAAARVTSTISSTNPLSNQTFVYDELDRLIETSGSQNQTLAYDALGNITHNSALGTYRYDDPDHPHAVTRAGPFSYSYDANGNMASVRAARQSGPRASFGSRSSFQWDQDNRLSRATVNGRTTNYAYDPGGRRISRSGSGRTTKYFGALVEFSGEQLVKYYFAGAMLVARREGSSVAWYHQDRLGSVRLMTDHSGQQAVASYDFAPFGQTLQASASVTNNFGWGGHRSEEGSGLIYMNARYYDSRLGRFLSCDPIVPELENPQALNRYAFAYNNPISNVDPTGHAPVAAAIVAAAAVQAAGAQAWVTAVAYLGAATSIAGYATHDETLSTLGSILLGFASGYAGGAGSLGAPGWGGALLGAGNAAATSPLSPLSPQERQTVGWAYLGQGLISAQGAAGRLGNVLANGTIAPTQSSEIIKEQIKALIKDLVVHELLKEFEGDDRKHAQLAVVVLDPLMDIIMRDGVLSGVGLRRDPGGKGGALLGYDSGRDYFGPEGHEGLGGHVPEWLNGVSYVNDRLLHHSPGLSPFSMGSYVSALTLTAKVGAAGASGGTLNLPPASRFIGWDGIVNLLQDSERR